jgi:hypothetical protein
MNTQPEAVHEGIGLCLHRVLPPDRDALLAMLADMAGCTPGKFPGPNPCSLERANFSKLRAQPYYLAEKTNGVRFILFMCRYKGLDVAAIINRAMQVFLLPCSELPTAMFQGSLVDCELAWNKINRAWQLMAFDAYVVCGVPVHRCQFSARLAALRRAMAVYRHTEVDPVEIRIKHFVPATMFGAYLDHEGVAKEEFDVDGIVLVPEHSAATVGRAWDLFKFKTKHSVDFLVGSRGVDVCVFDPATQTHAPVGALRSATKPGSIVECVLGVDGVWDVECVRTDKSTANDMLTYQRTLVNMREAISVGELQAVFVARVT